MMLLCRQSWRKGRSVRGCRRCERRRGGRRRRGSVCWSRSRCRQVFLLLLNCFLLGKKGSNFMLLDQEEDEKRAKEEQERREEEEYLKLKASFVVEEQGEEELLSEDQSRHLLQDFINYIQNSKVVLLEDLASQFGMRTQDAISRVQDLLAEGTLTGVMDDRGKFISITPEELDSVAQFIRQRGRVSITELAQASNSLINLTPHSRSTA
uniref:DDRGK domain-containing protein 1 n=1 Tax=Oryzias sinensis TaxID=183150 RepID=A0A8C7WXT3_9TELE